MAVPVHYLIRVKGRLSEQWSDWLGGMEMLFLENGDTLMSGPLPDQAALFSVLIQIRDLGAALLSVNPMEREDGIATLQDRYPSA